MSGKKTVFTTEILSNEDSKIRNIFNFPAYGQLKGGGKAEVYNGLQAGIPGISEECSRDSTRAEEDTEQCFAGISIVLSLPFELRVYRINSIVTS